MNYVVLVQVVDSAQNLLDGLRGILFSELSLLANPVKQLSSGGQLGDDVVLVLNEQRHDISTRWDHVIDVLSAYTYSGLEPIDKFDDVRVLQALEQVELV